MIASMHFEVVDADDNTVGNARFTQAHDAHALRVALADVPGVGKVSVAEVIERVTITRQVVRMPHRLCPGRP